MLPCSQRSWHRLVFTVRAKEVRFVLLLRILTRFDRAVRPRLALMEPAVESCPVIPASGRSQENLGGLRRAASARCGAEVCFISARFYKEPQLLKRRRDIVP